MATEIKTWQVIDGKLTPLDESLADADHWEKHLEQWTKTHPEVIGEGIVIIGQQVHTKSGPLDFLGIDRSGNLVVIELKRGQIPREALAQAIDYASDIASWDADRVSEVCLSFTGKNLEEYLNESFEELDVEEVAINKGQRVLLVGFSIEESLVRMIEWLSDGYDLSINAVVLHFTRTKGGEEFISRTSIIPDDVENEKARKGHFTLKDERPGHYDDETLREKMRAFLTRNRRGPARIREVLLPLCLEKDVVPRNLLVQELMKTGAADDEGKAGLLITTISNLLAYRKRDYLRQVLEYKPDKDRPWMKTDFRIRPQYRDMIQELLKELQE